jgi:hypothetical protein
MILKHHNNYLEVFETPFSFVASSFYGPFPPTPNLLPGMISSLDHHVQLPKSFSLDLLAISAVPVVEGAKVRSIDWIHWHTRGVERVDVLSPMSSVCSKKKLCRFSKFVFCSLITLLLVRTRYQVNRGGGIIEIHSDSYNCPISRRPDGLVFGRRRRWKPKAKTMKQNHHNHNKPNDHIHTHGRNERTTRDDDGESRQLETCTNLP